MKRKHLLLIDGDFAVASALAIAAVSTGHDVVRAFTRHEALCLLEHGLADVEAIVIDLAAGVYGMAVLQEMEISPATPPIIALTDLNDPYTSGIAAVHGVAACVPKPVTAGRLIDKIKEVCDKTRRVAAHSCDCWGHPRVQQHDAFPAPGWHRSQVRPPTALERASL